MFLLSALCVVPARAVVSSSDTVRVEAVDGLVRVSVKDGKTWRPVLESAASLPGARLNTLKYSRADLNDGGALRIYSANGAVNSIHSTLSPGENRVHVDISVVLDSNHPVDLEAIDTGWNFLGGKPISHGRQTCVRPMTRL